MANREALRHLQSRLAARLQAARTEPSSVAWLAVECASHGLLVPLATAGEIFPAGALLPVPHTKPWFLGVANLRGGLHGVVDLAAFLGLRPPMARDSVREQARLLSLSAQLGAHSAVLVDRLAGLRSRPQMTEITTEATVRPAFATGLWRDAEGRRWQEIDLAALSRDDQYLAIAQGAE